MDAWVCLRDPPNASPVIIIHQGGPAWVTGSQSAQKREKNREKATHLSYLLRHKHKQTRPVRLTRHLWEKMRVHN